MENGTKQLRVRRVNHTHHAEACEGRIVDFGLSHDLSCGSLTKADGRPAPTRRMSEDSHVPLLPPVKSHPRNSLSRNHIEEVPIYSNLCAGGGIPLFPRSEFKLPPSSPVVPSRAGGQNSKPETRNQKLETMTTFKLREYNDKLHVDALKPRYAPWYRLSNPPEHRIGIPRRCVNEVHLSIVFPRNNLTELGIVWII